MKKIILLLSLLVSIVSYTYSQYKIETIFIDELDNKIDCSCTHETIFQVPDCITILKAIKYKANPNNILEIFNAMSYSFNVNNKWYMVSYENTSREIYRSNKFKRNLVLWRFDEDALRTATINPLQVDYADGNEYHNYFQWIYATGDSKTKDKDGEFSASLNGHVKKHPNGDVEIKLINIQFYSDRKRRYTVYNKIIYLKPIGNEMYEVVEKLNN